jgi:putative redox protein
MAGKTLNASVRWTDGKRQMVGQAGSGHAIVLDTAKDDGGSDTGMRPLELLLVGQAGCTGLDVVFVLQKMRKDVTGVEVAVEGLRREEHPRVFTRIDVVYRVKGRGISEADVKKAIRLSETQYCSASAIIAKSAEIHSRYELTDEATGQTVSGDVGHEQA